MSREYFAIYADTCFAHFGDRVKTWTTINEPLHIAVGGYDTGTSAPGRSENSSTETYLAAHHMILANAAAVSLYHSKYKVQYFTTTAILLLINLVTFLKTFYTFMLFSLLLLAFSYFCSHNVMA